MLQAGPLRTQQPVQGREASPASPLRRLQDSGRQHRPRTRTHENAGPGWGMTGWAIRHTTENCTERTQQRRKGAHESQKACLLWCLSPREQGLPWRECSRRLVCCRPRSKRAAVQTGHRGRPGLMAERTVRGQSRGGRAAGLNPALVTPPPDRGPPARAAGAVALLTDNRAGN